MEAPTVKTIDEVQVKKDLKNCPKSVQDYVKAIERSRDSWRNISQKAIRKLRNQ